MTDGTVVVISKHAKKQLEKRGLIEADVIEALEKGEEIYDQINSRLGKKIYSSVDVGANSLIAVWFWNRGGEKQIVTVYWRRKKK